MFKQVALSLDNNCDGNGTCNVNSNGKGNGNGVEICGSSVWFFEYGVEVLRTEGSVRR